MDVVKMKPRRLLLEIATDFEKDIIIQNFQKRVVDKIPFIDSPLPDDFKKEDDGTYSFVKVEAPKSPEKPQTNDNYFGFRDI